MEFGNDYDDSPEEVKEPEIEPIGDDPDEPYIEPIGDDPDEPYIEPIGDETETTEISKQGEPEPLEEPASLEAPEPLKESKDLLDDILNEANEDLREVETEGLDTSMESLDDFFSEINRDLEDSDEIGEEPNQYEHELLPDELNPDLDSEVLAEETNPYKKDLTSEEKEGGFDISAEEKNPYEKHLTDEEREDGSNISVENENPCENDLTPEEKDQDLGVPTNDENPYKGDLLPEEIGDDDDFSSFYELMKEYNEQGRMGIKGSKFTKKFKTWIEDNPSINEEEKQKFLENWEDSTAIIPKIRLKELQEIIEEQGGKLHTTEYSSSRTKVKVECAEGHIWQATPEALKEHRWCHKCAGVERGTIEEIQDIVEQRGGKLHSTEYVNNRTKVEVECEEGHIWQVTPRDLKQGRWCRKCAGLERGTIEKVREIVEQRGGKLHSTEYVNNRTKVEVECGEGHVWQVTPHDLKAGYWCRKCAGVERGTIEEVREIVERQGGKLHSTEYVNNRTKVKIECEEGHIWEVRPNDLKSGHWCLKCSGSERGTVEEIREIVEQRGGKLHSTEYINAQIKVEVECADGHVWEVKPNHLKSGHWCPECGTGRSERVCRNIFEAIFNKEFPTRRPEWLVNDRGNQMELDGYNEDLAVAFEYQGGQHYHYHNLFHESLEDFEQRIADDNLKRKVCMENNVTLIEVPYTVQYNQLPNYIIDECKKKNIQVPEIDEHVDFNKIINRSFIKSRENEKEYDNQKKIDKYISEEDRGGNKKEKEQ